MRYTDFAIINGKPAITFSDGDNHDLNYFREGMEDYIVLSGDLNASGGFNSLQEVEGHAAIAFRDLGADYDMRYAIPSTFNGAAGSWHWAEFLDGERGPGSYFCDSLAIGDRIVVCYGDRGGSDGDKLRWCWREAGSFGELPGD